jgi:hypothetical protein
MLDEVRENGRMAFCWGCASPHYTHEAKAPRENHWLDLCESCMADYFQGRTIGAVDAKRGRKITLKEWYELPRVVRYGYRAGSFFFNAKGKIQTKGGSTTERLLHP